MLEFLESSFITMMNNYDEYVGEGSQHAKADGEMKTIKGPNWQC